MAEKTTPDVAPVDTSHDFETGTPLDVESLSDRERAYLDQFPNNNTERALAESVVRLSRKVR